jgi:Ni,Fe-hydrogenase III large subunit
MSSIEKRLARVYARATTATLCTALDEAASCDGPEYAQVCRWLITEIERRSPAADAAAEALMAGDNYPSQADYARTVAAAARKDPQAT